VVVVVGVVLVVVTIIVIIIIIIIIIVQYSVVKVLCYKSEGRWFDPSRCPWIFH